MEKQDLFLEIAMTKHPIGMSDQEVQPVSVTRETFDQSIEKPGNTPWAHRLTFEQEQEGFKEELIYA